MSATVQSRTLFGYYNVYRVVVGIILMSMIWWRTFSVGDFRHAAAFQLITIIYFVFSISSLLIYRISKATDDRQIVSSVFLDIAILHALFFCGDGITGGLSNLLVISIAAGNIMLRGTAGYFLAAAATLLSLALEGERFTEGLNNIGDLARAGIAGAVYFSAAFFMQYLSNRLSQSERLAEKQEKDIQSLLELNHQVIQTMRTGIIVCDRSMKIEIANHACENLVGLRANQSLPDILIERIQHWQKYPSIRPKPFQVDKDKPLVQANFSPMKQSESGQLLIFLEDTRKITQQAQQMKLASLGRLTASIAHEIRNPLGAISHATQLLAESEGLDEGDQKMAEIIQRHCLRMNTVIENTLSLSRRAQPVTEDMAIYGWLQTIVDDMRQRASKEQEIKLVSQSTDPRAKFDPTQMQQVVTNLLQNALRHNIQGLDAQQAVPAIEVKLGALEENEQAYIDIIDHGKGVDEEHIPHLFEPFFTTENEGTGLGLYLSREICEANQAQLDYIPQQNGGACFRILFAYNKKLV